MNLIPFLGVSFYLLHPNMSMQVLHSVLFAFPILLTRRICLTIESFSIEFAIISFIVMT